MTRVAFRQIAISLYRYGNTKITNRFTTHYLPPRKTQTGEYITGTRFREKSDELTFALP